MAGENVYCLLADVKRRLPGTTDSDNAEILQAAEECSRMVDDVLDGLGIDNPLEGSNDGVVLGSGIPSQLRYLVADGAAALYKRRFRPEVMDAGYWDSFNKKIEIYVKNRYKKGVFKGLDC